MTATWLADVLRAAGLTVDETLVPDWKQRGHTDGPFAPVGVMGHHTACGPTGDLPSLGTVRDGRPDLAGPLANLMLSRSGTWVPIAAGRCWHAGAADRPSAWPWVPHGDGNGYLIGIEAESSGTGDWTPEQLTAYPLGVAALLAHLGAGPDRFLGHLEWAPSRKVDPADWPGGMNAFRTSVANPEEFTVAQYDEIMRYLVSLDARLRGDPAFPNDSLQRILAKLDVIQGALIGGNTGGRNNFHWIDSQDQSRADAIRAELDQIRADIAKLTPPAKS